MFTLCFVSCWQINNTQNTSVVRRTTVGQNTDTVIYRFAANLTYQQKSESESPSSFKSKGWTHFYLGQSLWTMFVPSTFKSFENKVCAGLFTHYYYMCIISAISIIPFLISGLSTRSVFWDIHKCVNIVNSTSTLAKLLAFQSKKQLWRGMTIIFHFILCPLHLFVCCCFLFDLLIDWLIQACL